jgi:hypothetical protein
MLIKYHDSATWYALLQQITVIHSNIFGRPRVCTLLSLPEYIESKTLVS